MDGQSDFSLAVSQNKYLSTGYGEMHAVLTITKGDGQGHGDTAPEAAEVLLVDCSSSMDWPPTKIAAARRATAAAIDVLRDGVFFAVVEGTSRARMVYPSTPSMAEATPGTKAEASAAVARLIASGGTAIGTWLTQARELLDEHPTALRHALLLTDGKNESESTEQLERVLDACEGHFVCDARGIGDGWEPTELLRIVDVLRGVADAVREDAELAEDFRKLIQVAMGKVVPDLRIRIGAMPYSRVRFLKQVFPTESDLTERCAAAGERLVELSTGSWGDAESREYHLCLDVDPTGLARYEDVQVAWVELAQGSADAQRTGTPVPICGHWTDNPILSTRIDPKVGPYIAQGELSQAVSAGCAAFEAGDLDTAKREWGRAVRLASELGNAEMLERLARLVDIDPGTGLARIKENLGRGEVISAMMGSRISSLGPDGVPRKPADGRRIAGPDRTCPDCQLRWPPDAMHCEKCGRRVADDETGEWTAGQVT